MFFKSGTHDFLVMQVVILCYTELRQQLAEQSSRDSNQGTAGRKAESLPLCHASPSSRHFRFFPDLSEKTRSAETFLLSSAALANLTFMESSVVSLMKSNGTVPVLVGAVLRQQKNVSIYIQDQVGILCTYDCSLHLVR